MDNSLDKLSLIQAVDEPPFLWTRIQQKIKAEKENQLSPQWTWALGLSFLVVVALNIALIVSKSHESMAENKNIAQSLSLLPQNALYK